MRGQPWALVDLWCTLAPRFGMHYDLRVSVGQSSSMPAGRARWWRLSVITALLYLQLSIDVATHHATVVASLPVRRALTFRRERYFRDRHNAADNCGSMPDLKSLCEKSYFNFTIFAIGQKRPQMFMNLFAWPSDEAWSDMVLLLGINTILFINTFIVPPNFLQSSQVLRGSTTFSLLNSSNLCRRCSWLFSVIIRSAREASKQTWAEIIRGISE